MIRSEHHEETVNLPIPASVGYQIVANALRKVGTVQSAQPNLLRLSGSIGGGLTNATKITVQVTPDGDDKCKIAVQGICREGLLTGGNVIKSVNRLLDNLEIPQPTSPSTKPTPQTSQKNTRYCGNCGSPNPIANKFCGNCGTPLST